MARPTVDARSLTCPTRPAAIAPHPTCTRRSAPVYDARYGVATAAASSGSADRSCLNTFDAPGVEAYAFAFV
jgi:hypothetical protein